MKKIEKPFDFSRTVARKVAFKVSYLGSQYFGFSGKMEDAHPTIEGELFKALTKCKLVPNELSCQWSKAGRTDKGVSAFGQVVSLWIKTKLPASHPAVRDWDTIKDLPLPSRPKEGETLILYNDLWDKEYGEEFNYLDILNRLLPNEIRILAWTPVHESFDARFSCQWRKYHYYFPSRFLDIEKMKKAAALFIGRHDCRFICKIDTSKIDGKDFFIRNIYESHIEELDDSFCRFVVKGRAFLWHQVRNMMALLFLVGRNLEETGIISTMLDPSCHPDNAGKPNYEMAPDSPLVLLECGYDKLHWKVDNYQRTVELIETQWADASLKAKQLQSLKNEFIQLGAQANTSPIKSVKHVDLMKRTRADSVSTLKAKKKAKSRKEF